jgi:uncharacterized protein
LPHLTLLEWGLCFAVVTFGATTQGVVGLGLNLIGVPIIAMINPDAVPASFLLIGIPLSLTIAIRERHAIDRSGIGWIIAGRVPGTILGLIVVSALAPNALLVAVGCSIIIGVCLLSLRSPSEITPLEAGTAGIAAGALGTAAAVDGPPLALLYQHHAGERLRATLAVSFVVGNVMSLTALAIAGELGWPQVSFAICMLPAIAIGYAVSHPIRERVDGTKLRPYVLLIALSAGFAVLIRGVF